MKMHDKLLKIYTEHKSYSLLGIAVVTYISLLGIFTLLPSNSPFEANEGDAIQTQKTTAISTDLSAINKWHLFGKNDLEKFTNSNIKLIGIIFQDNASEAIMLVNSEEHIFKSGDKINSLYVIEKIEPSRVVISTNEGPQQLGLFEASDTANPPLEEVNALPASAAEFSNNNESQDYNISSENNQVTQDQVIEQPVANDTVDEEPATGIENPGTMSIRDKMRRFRNE